jgi:hypothetical protein
MRCFIAIRNENNFGGVMKYFQYMLLVILSYFLLYCGADYAAEGTMAFEKKDYSDTIRLLTLALREDSTNHSYDEMICISYLYRGEELFVRTRNLKAFDGNFRKAQGYLPVKPSKEFEKILMVHDPDLPRTIESTESDLRLQEGILIILQAIQGLTNG